MSIPEVPDLRVGVIANTLDDFFESHRIGMPVDNIMVLAFDMVDNLDELAKKRQCVASARFEGLVQSLVGASFGPAPLPPEMYRALDLVDAAIAKSLTEPDTGRTAWLHEVRDALLGVERYEPAPGEGF